MNKSEESWNVCLHSFKSQLSITFDFLKNKGLDYVGEMKDESFYSGQANDKYINDDKKIFSLQDSVDVVDKTTIQQKVQSEEFFVVGVLKKDNRIIFNDLTMSNTNLKNLI